MSQTSETLIEFIQRVRRQKGLSLHDIERNSGKEITSSHVSKILKGSVRSISVETIAGLAKGLGVDPFDVFAAALGSSNKRGDELSPMLLIDILQKVAENPQLVKVVQGWTILSVKGRAALLQYMEVLCETSSQQKSRNKRRSK